MGGEGKNKENWKKVYGMKKKVKEKQEKSGKEERKRNKKDM